MNQLDDILELLPKVNSFLPGDAKNTLEQVSHSVNRLPIGEWISLPISGFTGIILNQTMHLHIKYCECEQLINHMAKQEQDYKHMEMIGGLWIDCPTKSDRKLTSDESIQQTLRACLTSKYLITLQSLKLPNWDLLTDDIIITILTPMRNLQQLYLPRCSQLTTSGWLVEHGEVKSLNTESDSHVTHPLSGLQVLDMSHCTSLNDQDLWKLLISMHQLRKLKLRGCVSLVGDELKVIFDGYFSRNETEGDDPSKLYPWWYLEEIDFSNCVELTDDIVDMMKFSGHLVWLNLSGCTKLTLGNTSYRTGMIDDWYADRQRGHPELINNFHKYRDNMEFKTVKHLDLSGCTALDDEEVGKLLRYMDQLQTLKLKNCTTISGSGWRYNPLWFQIDEWVTTTGSPFRWWTLTELDARNCSELSDKFVSSLAFSKGLQKLNLSGCTSVQRLDFTDFLDYMRQCQMVELDRIYKDNMASMYFTQLQHVDLKNCSLSPIDLHGPTDRTVRLGYKLETPRR
jgi:hypothetical protein